MTALFTDKRLYVIFSITVISVMGVASITPALPKMAAVLQLTRREAGWLISAFTLPGVFLTPITGMLADRIGRKKILLPSLILFAIGGFSLFFTRKFSVMILLRLLQGVGAASLPSLNTTLIGDFYFGENRPTIMGYNSSVLNMATALYPLIGGFLAGFAWYYPFLLPLLAIPAAFFFYFGIEEPQIEKPSSFKDYFKTMGTHLLRKEVLTIFILGILTFIIIYGSLITYLPFLLDQKFGLSSPKIGMMASLSSISSIIIATQIGRLTRNFGSIRLIKIAFSLFIIINLLFPYLHSLPMFILPILFFGMAQALNMPSLQTMLVNCAPDHLRAAFMSLNGMNLRLGQTLGPLIIGVGYSFYGFKGGYFMVSAFALLGLVLVFLVFKRK